MKRLFPFVLLLLVAGSCGPNEECRDCAAKNEKDSVIVEPADDFQSALAKDTATVLTKDQKENHDKIVRKYGEQWDFCKCIVANDSINDAIESGKLSDAQLDKVLARWEYVDTKCKELTTMPSNTPEERARHDKRVNKCLKQNGLKK